MNNVVTSTSESDPDYHFLRELVAIESPSFDAESSARVVAPIAERLRAAGGDVKLVTTEAGTNLVADFAGPGAPLLFVGHTDTVWPHGTLANDLPWSQEAGITRGPGVYDMKSGIVIMCAALERTRNTRTCAVRVLLTCDEEVGSPTSRDLIIEAARGVRAAIGFESPHPDGALKVGRRGSTRLSLTVTGKAAHAALEPEKGTSAINELVDQLVQVRGIIEDIGNQLSPVLCNIGTVSGGSRANVVAEQASAEIGLRFIDRESETATLSALSSLRPLRAGAQITTSILSSRPAWKASAADDSFLEELTSAASRLGQPLSGRPAAGAGDTNLVGSLGVASVDGFGPLGGGAHALTEHIITASLADRIALLCEVLNTEPTRISEHETQEKDARTSVAHLKEASTTEQ